MHILFFGQLGLPRLVERDAATTERRVADVALKLAELGHQVTVLGTKPYLTLTGSNYHGVSLKPLLSLNPEQPGGWLYLLLGVATIWRRQPAVVHVHTWQAASLARLIRFGNRHATLVFTIDGATVARSAVQRWIVRPFDVLTTPTRQLQYQNLSTADIRAQYVPDGYTMTDSTLLPAKQFGLRHGAYSVLFAATAREVRLVAEAYRRSGTRKKLVVIASLSPATKTRLAKQYRFLHCVGEQHSRARRSLVAGSQLVIAHCELPAQTLLETMAAGKTIVSAAFPLHQEVCGVTARFYQATDGKGLQAVLRTVVTDTAAQGRWGRAANRRAQTHFRLDRIVAEYLTVYQAVRILVPVDSVLEKPLHSVA